MHKVTVEFELTDAEVIQLRQNSIERVLSNGIEVGQLVELSARPPLRPVSPTLAESASTLWQDCEELKPVVTKLWGALQNAVFPIDASTRRARGYPGAGLNA
jgi:hypothetical protein